MILEIVKYPNPVLRKKCEKVESLTPEVKKLIEDMIETMREGGGIGLAAPQVGILKRIIVVETPEGPRGFVNPKVVRRSRKKEVIEEGCLSFPSLFLKIKRAREVEVETLDEKGKRIKVQGLLARVLQHEIDHLDGILFIDKIGFWQRLKLKKLF
jgi:peptide deformylase